MIRHATAKAGLENLTNWLAVDLAQEHGPELRVNAFAHGFFVGVEQNRTLLLAEDSLTERGRRIIEHTPMGNLGAPKTS